MYEPIVERPGITRGTTEGTWTVNIQAVRVWETPTSVATYSLTEG